MELAAGRAAAYIRSAMDALTGGSTGISGALELIGGKNFGTGRENDPLITTGTGPDGCCFNDDCFLRRAGSRRSPTV